MKHIISNKQYFPNILLYMFKHNSKAEIILKYAAIALAVCLGLLECHPVPQKGCGFNPWFGYKQGATN